MRGLFRFRRGGPLESLRHDAIGGALKLAKVALNLGHTVQTCVTYYAGLTEGYDPDLERGNVSPRAA